MNLRSWLKQFDGYSEEMLDKEILIECPNGLMTAPTIKFQLNSEIPILRDVNEVRSLVISWRD